jgi:hypothetical protein
MGDSIQNSPTHHPVGSITQITHWVVSPNDLIITQWVMGRLWVIAPFRPLELPYHLKKIVKFFAPLLQRKKTNREDMQIAMMK